MRSSIAAKIETGLRRAGSKARAEGAKAYLKSDLEHLGVTVPAMRAVVVAALRERPALERAELIAAVKALWKTRIFDLRAAAVELLMKRARLLVAADVPMIEQLVRESKTWALVDALAPHVMGRLVERHPELGRTLDRWARDDDFWLRRAAMLSLLLGLRAGAGDFERFGCYADAMLEDQEFFIRKAIGWVLRETARKQPALVVRWLEPRIARASGLTVREAVRHLPARDRERLQRARDEGSIRKARSIAGDGEPEASKRRAAPRARIERR
jgi:3-methyladenine DNA glycosylase AlkD